MKTPRLTLLLLFIGFSISAYSQKGGKEKAYIEENPAVDTAEVVLQYQCINLLDDESRVLLDQKGVVIGTIEDAQDDKSSDYLDKQLIRIGQKDIPVSKLTNYRWLPDGRLLFFDSPPNSHRGGGMAIEIVNVVTGQSTGLMNCGSGVSSEPIVSSNGNIWIATVHGNEDSLMSVLKVSLTDDMISVEARLPVLWSTRLAISPDGKKLLCSGTQIGKFEPEYYLIGTDHGKEPRQLTGLLNHNTWVNNNEIFTTNGYVWSVINPQSDSNQLESNWFSSPLTLVGTVALLQDKGLVVVGSRKVNSDRNDKKHESTKSLVLFINLDSHNQKEYLIDCPSFNPASLTIQGYQDNKIPWFGTDQVLLKLSN